MRGFIGAWRPRLGRLAGIVVSLLIIAGFAFVLLQIASGASPTRATVGDDPTSTPPPTALATSTTAATATGAATVTPHATATPGGLGQGSGGNPTPGFAVQSIPSASVDFNTDPGYPGLATDTDAPIPSATGGCGPHVTFYVTFSIILSNNPTPPNQKEGATALIGYYTRNSDGSTFGSAAHPKYEMIPSGGDDMIIITNWTMPYTLASGAAQWTELDIIQPNQISYRLNYKALCAFSLFPQVSVSPAAYNCAAGGDQTFTLTGTLKASFTTDPSSHTITYFWETDFSANSSNTPTQTLTFPPGATSMPLQPVTAIGNAANPAGGWQPVLRVSYDGTPLVNGIVTIASAC